MRKVQTRPLTLFAAGLVIGFYILVASLKGLGGPLAAHLTNDAIVLLVLKAAVLFAFLLYAGHKALDWIGIAHYAAYLLIGAVAAVIVEILYMSGAVWDQVIASGTLSTHFLVPAFFGALAGGGYYRVSLYYDDDEDPDALAAAWSQRVGTEGGDAGLIAQGDMEFFDGPVRVRTSIPALMLAAAAGCLVDVVFTTIFRLSTYSSFHISDGNTQLDPDVFLQSMGGFLSGLVFSYLSFLPVIFLVLLAHMALRGMRQTGYAAYGIAGLLASPVVTLLTGGLGGIALFAILPSMFAAVAYRRLAGLEPAPVAEDITARNRRDLVGKDHVRRRAGRVTMETERSSKAPLFSRKP